MPHQSKWPFRRGLVASAMASLALVSCAVFGSGTTSARDAAAPAGSARHCQDYSAKRNPYFGDLHVHTKYSLDANTQGTIISPQDAYRFAQGEKLGIQPYDGNGHPLRYTQLARPLDFAAVTDHAEFYGEIEICSNPALKGYNSSACVQFRDEPDKAFYRFNTILAKQGQPTADGGLSVPHPLFCGANGERCLEAAKTPWQDIQDAAEAFYDRSDDCAFTTFVGYEYSASTNTNSLHRNVIFETEHVPALPTSYLDAAAPELLWKALAQDCTAADGCYWLTIPHNSNLAGGLMFQTTDVAGNDYSAQFAAERQQAEPLFEIYQHKGSSECTNAVGLGKTDELCGFEKLPYDNLIANRFGGVLSGKPKEQDFIRYGLEVGLLEEQKLGVNPFKYGIIADTDTHIGTPGNVLENNFPGHAGEGKSARTGIPAGLSDNIEYSPGGLAVLWAEQNTRESLFGAMRRREAYGTSGHRPVVRFFGGWNLPASQCSSPDFAGVGYRRGVPMGGDLPAQPTQRSRPRFAVSALRDPGAPGEPTQPLQRIQIVKGWIDNGERKEAVYDIAGNPDNGAAVDISTCETSGNGYASLCTVWEDRDFDAKQSAFYYARVVENPSCRWTQYQCVAAHVDCSDPASVPPEYAECCSADYPKTIQERAWTSPIWFKPKPAAAMPR